MSKLKEMREKRGLTQAALADKSDINVRTLQCYEQGIKDINKAAAISVYKLAQALRCAVEDLIDV